MERKTGTAFLKRLDGKGSGIAVIATLTLPGAPPVIDRDGDVTLAGAFGSPVVPVVGSHRWDQPPIGKATISEAGSEVVADFRLNLATDGGKEWYEALRFDFEHPPAKTEWSYGFSIPPGGAEFRTLENGQRVRVLKRLQIFEVSPVLAGAGVGTRTLALKHAGASEEREALRAHLQSLPPVEREALLEQMRAWTLEAQLVLRDMAYDDLFDNTEKARNEGFRYKYKFVDLPPEDARHVAAMRGVIAAAAELHSEEPSLRFFAEALAGEQYDFLSDRALVGAGLIPAVPDVIGVHVNCHQWRRSKPLDTKSFTLPVPGCLKKRSRKPAG